MSDVLTEREQNILSAVVHQFLLTGTPVGSRVVSKSSTQNLSAASIRNVMADLEEKGYLGHPHTSAGRVPTSKGYRIYVDSILQLTSLSISEQARINENIGQYEGDIDRILDQTLNVLSTISNQLGVILTPQFEEGILEKLDLVKLSSEKLLVVLSIRSGIAKTITLEVSSEIQQERIMLISQILNERLAGLRIRDIRLTFVERVRDLIHEDTGLVRLFIDSADKVFDFSRFSDVRYSGTTNIISKPEFADVHRFSTLIEMLESKNIIIHMMQKRSETSELKITIGSENDEMVKDCSIITAPYRVGEVEGVLGIIGPMRMSYQRVIPIVDYTARFITRLMKKNG
jgi:heat-inducible transcriptional repressor